MVCQMEMSTIPKKPVAWEIPRMDKTLFRERLRERLDAKNISPHRLSAMIGAGQTYVRDLLDPDKGGIPRSNYLLAMATALDCSADYLAGDAETAEPVQSEVGVRDLVPGFNNRPRPEQPGIPLVGTGDCASLQFAAEDGTLVDIERSSFDPDHTVRMITRPPALTGAKDIYAIYFQGESMMPRFEPGEVALVDPTRPPRPGDYVLVQLNNGSEDDVCSVLVKRLVSANSKAVTLHQFNPDVTFKVERTRVARLHRIMPQTDLLFG